MSDKRVLIVGGVAGGATCAARLRRLCETCEIVLFEMGPYVSFANCGLPYYVGDVIVEEEKLLVATPRLFRERFNIEVRTESQVTAIDRAARTIEVKNLKTGEVSHEPYDALVLATGAEPVWPDIPGADLPGIHALRTIPDSRQVRQQLQDARRAVVMGGGYLGLELTENLKQRGLDVTLLQSADQLMPSLDREMASYVERRLGEHGVDFRLKARVIRFEADAEGGLVVHLAESEPLLADVVLICTGVRPRADLARAAGLEIGDFGGVRVDERLCTSDPYIWAVGDVVEVNNAITGQWQWFPLAGPANKQGRIAAAHIAAHLIGRARAGSAADMTFRGVQETSVCGVFGLTVATTGLSEKRLQESGYRHYQKVYLHPGNHVGYYPGAKPIHMKLLYDTDSGRVLGAQALGEAGVARRIDVISAFLQMEATVFDLEEAELCYAPQFGATKDPVNLAGMIAANHLRGAHPLARWEELLESHIQVVGPNQQDEAGRLLSLILSDPFQQAQIVDVRSKAEFARDHIPGAVNIPLDNLRHRLDELSRQREVWLVCGVGLRAYNATRILQQNGFRVRNLSGGMQTYRQFRGEDNDR